MNSVIRLLLRAAEAALIIVVTGLSPVANAHPTSVEIAGTWTGLEFNAHAGGSRFFALELTVDPVAGGTPTQGEMLSGTWTSQPVARDRRGRQQPPQVERVTAEYHGDSGIMRVTRRPQAGGRGYDVLVVFDSNAGRLAGVYTGGMKDMTPFSAARGGALSPELAGATGLARGQLISEAFGAADAPALTGDWRADFAAAMAAGDYERARTIVPPPGRTPAPTPTASGGSATPAAPDPAAEFQALQLQVQQAAARGDREEIRRLQEEIRKTRAEMAAQRQRPAATPPPSTRAASSRCPDHLVAWAAQLDTYGGSVEHFEGNNHLSNLFRPSLFVPYFGKPFSALSQAERVKIAGELQQSCLMDGTPLGRGSAIGALIGVFQDTPGFAVAQAGLGGIALEIIADWNLRVVRDLGAEPEAARVTDFEAKSAQLAGHLFERERDETRRQLAALKSRNHGRRLLAETDALERAAAAGNAGAIVRLAELPFHADAAKLSAADRAPFDERHTRALADTVALFLSRAREQTLTGPADVDRLIRGKAWLASNGEALQALRSRPETGVFYRDFLAARTESYAAVRERLSREIEALNTREALERFPAAFVIYTDAGSSPAWKELDARRQEKILEHERREFLARTGAGPFGPDHPGAVYLNALWRNDQAQLEELDRRYRAPFLAQLGVLEQVDYTGELAERFTGDDGSADRRRRLRRALLEEASLANVLLVAFAFNFEEAYPACMDSNPVEFQIHQQRERLVRNFMGHAVSSVPDGVSTVTHRVNQRHATAVSNLRIADPNDTVLGEALFGRVDRDASFAQAGSGLARVMREQACDSEIVQRIEAGLLARWEAHAARTEAIRGRILGKSSLTLRNR